MVCRVGVRELQRASEMGHGRQGRPLLQIGGRLHVKSHPLPRPDAKDTCSRRLEPCGLRNGQELFRRHVAQFLDDARGPLDPQRVVSSFGITRLDGAEQLGDVVRTLSQVLDCASSLALPDRRCLR
jgi:hypothetical protein